MSDTTERRHVRWDTYEVDENGRYVGDSTPICGGCSDPELLADLARGELTEELPPWPCPTVLADAPESPVTPPTPSTPGAEASEGTGEAQEARE